MTKEEEFEFYHLLEALDVAKHRLREIDDISLTPAMSLNKIRVILNKWARDVIAEIEAAEGTAE